MRQRSNVHIGTSGYQYDHWRGVFYPDALPRERWLAHYAEHFATLEINSTFYGLPTAATVQAWRDAVPAAFRFAVKFSRYGSHMKKLKAPQATIGHFVERVDPLGDRLGPILVQLPGRWRVDAGRLAAFLEAAPPGYRWAIEVRDASWWCEAVYRVLETHHAALCWHDGLVDHPRRLTADWTYLRFHGDHDRGRYSPQYLTAQARRLRALRDDGTDVYAYFNNDAAGHAVTNARRLRRYLDHRSPG
ncbi:DUF72 domain-containing protein [Halomonas maura]|uniref:DUF72 domain-containing protein n=1 Tax=Halomonas maura TaxID=117606 RepID=UPI0025B5AC8D|nr:DUF72 domain-containing protein [Halomonas maura]MDN3556764.1 DUF72 domain-containing protein [Halomonas maura]